MNSHAGSRSNCGFRLDGRLSWRRQRGRGSTDGDVLSGAEAACREPSQSRRLLIHHVGPLEKKAVKVPLWADLRADPERGLAEIEGLLRRLETIDPVLRTVVELKVFEGLNAEEIAKRLNCSTISVNRNWQFARKWMKTEV